MSTKIKTRPHQSAGPHWQRWIAENLMLGAAPATLMPILVQNGVPAKAAQAEIEAAMRSPYLHGAKRLLNRIAKRDWVIGIQAKLDRIAPELNVERRERLSGDDFFQHYYKTNRPVIITGMLDGFPARSKWSLDYFAGQFGEREVEVQFGRSADPKYELNSIAHKRKLRFGDYVDMVRASGSSNDFYMTANNDSLNRKALSELWDDIGELPEYMTEGPTRQGFFWFGPAGTVTPYHHDLTNNFMMQIIGRKKVKLIAPCELARLNNQRHCFTDVDGHGEIDLQKYPAMAGVPVKECVLEAGEMLFLPVGWWHYVEGLDISVTVSATHFKWDNNFYTHYPEDHDF